MNYNLPFLMNRKVKKNTKINTKITFVFNNK